SIVESIAEIERVDVIRANHGVELQMLIADDKAERLQSRARSLVARTSCGLCGIETINDALRVPHEVGHTLSVTKNALWHAGAELSARQEFNRSTHTVHGAGWALPDGTMRLVRE